MCKGILIQFKYITFMVILGFSFTSCLEYDTYRKASRSNDSLAAKSSGTSQTGKNKQYAEKTQSGNKGSDVTQPIINEGQIPEEFAIGSNVGSDQQRTFLDRYEEQLKQLIENEKEINLYKEKQKEHEQTIKELKSKLETVTVEFEEKKKKALDLQEKNNMQIIEFSKKHSALKEKADGYKNEIKELKVKLVEAQISEVKAKQELVRVKTRYIMDKKRWGVQD